MAKKKTKKPGLSDKFWLWVSQNQKVLIVGLLAVCSVTFGASQLFTMRLGRTGDDLVVGTVFGRDLTRGEVTTLNRRVRMVAELAGEFVAMEYSVLPLDCPIQDFVVYLAEAKRMGLRISDHELGAARRKIWRWHVSWNRAKEQLAAEGKAEPKPGETQNRQYWWDLQMRQRTVLDQMEAALEFDRQDWLQMLEDPKRPARLGGRAQKVSVVAFEEALREVLLVARLDQFVKSTVHVTDEEVYEDYREKSQRRKLSWVKLEPSEELKDRVREGIEDDEVEAHYELDKQRPSEEQRFRKEPSLRCEYLLVPRDHFEDEVKKAITDEDIEKAYNDNRHFYLRPTVRGDDGCFQLLSEEEMEAEREELYRPLEEVRERVFDRLVKGRSNDKLREIGEEIRKRLYPPEPGKEKEKPEPRTFEEIAEEHPFVRTGKVPFVEEEEAEEVFGEAYDRNAVPSWFRSLKAEGGLQTAQEKALERPRSIYEAEPERGRAPDEVRVPRAVVFFRGVETRSTQVPELGEIRDEVVEDLVGERLLVFLAEAARKEVNAVNEGTKTFASLPGTEIDVPIDAGDETAASDEGDTDAAVVEESKTESASETEGAGEDGSDERPEDAGSEAESATPSDDSAGEAKTGAPAAEEDGAAENAESRAETDGGDEKAGQGEMGTEATQGKKGSATARFLEIKTTPKALRRPVRQPSGRVWFDRILLPKEDEDGEDNGEEQSREEHPASEALGTAGFQIEAEGKAEVARDTENHGCYVVHLDSISPADPGRFENQRSWLTRQLLSERRQDYFVDWRRELSLRAYGEAPGE